MRSVGFAVLPARGKRPLIKGYTSHQVAAKPETIGAWGIQFPGADIIYLPGLYRLDRKGTWYLSVVDADDLAAVSQVVDLFGSTPGQVRTRRGRHFLYRIRVTDVQCIFDVMNGNVDLRRFGIAGEIRIGHNVVVGPYSVHEDDPDFVYRWDGVDDAVVRDVAVFPIGILEDFVRAESDTEKSNLTSVDASFRDGSRGLFLNDQLCRKTIHFGCRQDVQEAAREINMRFPDMGYEPLDDAEVIRRADAVWRDVERGKLEEFHECRARSIIGLDEFDSILAKFGRKGNDAVALLTKLRGEHGGRTLRGETFAIADAAMVKARTLPGWHRRRIREARDILLDLGFIQRVAKGRGRSPAQYRLVLRGWQPRHGVTR